MQAIEVGDEDAWVLQPSAVAVLDGVWVGSAMIVGAGVFGSLLWAALGVLVCAGTHAVGRPRGRPRLGSHPRESATGVPVPGLPECAERGSTDPVEDAAFAGAAGAPAAGRNGADCCPATATDAGPAIALPRTEGRPDAPAIVEPAALSRADGSGASGL
ncbi:hypothetical protein AIIKEEIJ_05642 [Rhodococcus sp. YH1]|nr:hypothetical protein [Rhodococcus sp. YH1]